jgi:hypothetical protein
MDGGGYASASDTAPSIQSGNSTPHEGLKNMLDLAEVISELKAVIVQQNKLLELLSKNTVSGCPLGNVQQPQPNNPFGHPSYGGIKLMNGAAYCGFNPSPGFMFNGPNNNQYPNQTTVQPNVDALPIWHKPYIPIHCLLDWADSKGDVPRNFKLALVNSVVYKVPPVVVCHYKSMIGQSPYWGAHLVANLCKDTSGPWGKLTIDMFDLPAGTMVHRNSGHNEGGILYRIPGFQYPDPVSGACWF